MFVFVVILLVYWKQPNIWLISPIKSELMRYILTFFCILLFNHLLVVTHHQGCVLAPDSFATGMDWLIGCWTGLLNLARLVWHLAKASKQPKLTAIIQSRRLTLFRHIMRMDDNADAKRILLASPPADWRRQLGRPRITWLSTVQQDLKQHYLTLPEAADLAQNRPMWRMMSTYGATQS